MEKPDRLVSLEALHQKPAAGKAFGILGTLLSYLSPLPPYSSPLLTSMGGFTSYFIQERKNIRGKSFKFFATKSQNLLASAATFCFLSCHSG